MAGKLTVWTSWISILINIQAGACGSLVSAFLTHVNVTFSFVWFQALHEKKKNHSNLNNNNNILRCTHDMCSARARALIFRPLVYYSEGIKGWSKKRATLPATVQQSWNNTHKQTARCTHGSFSYTVSASTGCTQLRRDQQDQVCECVHAAGGYMRRVVTFTKFLVSYIRDIFLLEVNRKKIIRAVSSWDPL